MEPVAAVSGVTGKGHAEQKAGLDACAPRVSAGSRSLVPSNSKAMKNDSTQAFRPNSLSPGVVSYRFGTLF